MIKNIYKVLIILSDFSETWIILIYVRKIPNIKFQANLSSDSRTVPGRWTDGQTEMKKLIVALCNYINMPQNGSWRNMMGGCGMDSSGSGQQQVVDFCEHRLHWAWGISWLAEDSAPCR